MPFCAVLVGSIANIMSSYQAKDLSNYVTVCHFSCHIYGGLVSLEAKISIALNIDTSDFHSA